MKSTSRYVSNLDLKYLGSKFMTIPDSFEVSHNYTEIRKSRNCELPSILKTDLVDPAIHASLDPTDRPYGESQFSSIYQTRQKSKVPKKGTMYTEGQQKEINKYRSLIHRIKKDNELIHKEITNLYREKKLNDHEPKTKSVKKIFKAARQIPEVERKSRLGTQNKQFNQIYERLNSQDNPYRRESLEIQKKLQSSNLHKNFENFLQNHNKRVPDFIKNVR